MKRVLSPADILFNRYMKTRMPSVLEAAVRVTGDLGMHKETDKAKQTAQSASQPQEVEVLRDPRCNEERGSPWQRLPMTRGVFLPGKHGLETSGGAKLSPLLLQPVEKSWCLQSLFHQALEAQVTF